MINITTTEKWIELDNLEHPVKSDFNKIWLGLSLIERGKVSINFKFGKIETRVNEENENEMYFNPSQYEFDYSQVKTDAEIKAYSYDQLHLDAKAILESICLSEATFVIV